MHVEKSRPKSLFEVLLYLPSIAGWSNTYFSFEGFAKGHFGIIAELLRDFFRLHLFLEHAHGKVHTPAGEVFHWWLPYELSEAC